VSSTVNIKTPEFTESDAPFSPEEEGVPEPPFSPQSESAWRGEINMQDVAKFSVSAHEVSGGLRGLYYKNYISTLPI
jgi:hypothetical protein